MLLILYLFLLLCIIQCANSYHVPSRLLKNVIRKISTSTKSSSSSSLYSSIKDKLSNIDKKDINFNTIIANNGKDELFLFLIDLSRVGSTTRIHALQGAVGQLLPKHKVSVITCFEKNAQLLLEPTSSIMQASRALSGLKKSVMGDLGKGLNIALEKSDELLSSGAFSTVTLCIIADSNAHGLLAGHSTDCPLTNVCDDLLVDTAEKLLQKKLEFSKTKKILKTILIDTENGDRKEGQEISNVIQADYYHEPELTDDSLLNILFFPFYEI